MRAVCPLVPDGQLRASLAPSVNITQVANFGSGYDLLDMTTRPVQATYSTLGRSNHAQLQIRHRRMGRTSSISVTRVHRAAPYSFSSMANFLAGRLHDLHAELRTAGVCRVSHLPVRHTRRTPGRLNNRLTLNYGLRWDGDDITCVSRPAVRQFVETSVRAGRLLRPDGQGYDAAQGRNGLMYDRLWENPITPTYYNNEFVGQQISATWNFGQAGAPDVSEHDSRRGSPGQRAGRRPQRLHRAEPAEDAGDAAVHCHAGPRVQRQLLDQRQRRRDAFVEQGDAVRYESRVGQPGESRPVLLLRGRSNPSFRQISSTGTRSRRVTRVWS